MTLAPQRRRHTSSLMLSKGALGATCTTRVSLLPPASPYSVHRRRLSHPANPQDHQLFLRTPAGAQSTSEAEARWPDASRSHQQPGLRRRERLPSAKGRIESPDPAGPEGWAGRRAGSGHPLGWQAAAQQPVPGRQRAGRAGAQRFIGNTSGGGGGGPGAGRGTAVLQRRGARGRPRPMSASRPW